MDLSLETAIIDGEKNIKKQSIYWNSLLNNMNKLFYTYDNAGIITYVNQKIIDVLGFRPEEIIGKYIGDFVAKRYQQEFYRKAAQHLGSGQEGTYHIVIPDKSGREHHIKFSTAPIYEDTDIVGEMALAEDITDSLQNENELRRSNQILSRVEEELSAANQQLMATEEELRYQLEELEENKRRLDKAHQELLSSEARYRSIVENIEDGYYEVDLVGNYTFSNPYLQKFLGFNRDEMLGVNYRSFMDEENAIKVKEAFNKVYRSHQTIREFGWYILDKEGNRFYVETTVSPIIENNSVLGFRGIIRDLTRRKQDQEALRSSEARYRAIVEDQTEFICRFKSDGSLTFVNEAYCRYFKKSREELIGSYFLPHIFEADRPIVEAAIAGLNREEPVSSTEIRVVVDGEIYWHHWSHRVIYDENGCLVNLQSVGRDISEMKEAVEELEYLSMHDSLTGLYNRFYFEEEMRRLESSRFNPVAMIIFDVDGLKLVNDTLGHKKGDQLLITAADIISKSFRQGDVVARVGGDEFGVLLPKTPGHLVEEALKRISEQIKIYNQKHPELPLSISTGYAVRNDELGTMNDIFKEADNKMYRQKLHSRQSTRSVLVQTLMKALEARDFITEGHGDRLQILVGDMAEVLYLPDARVKDLRLLAQFHDIGKVGVPDAILFKKGPLNRKEYAEMQRHSEIGHRIALSAPDLVLIADWILKHHEWWNGQGYPLGLKEEEIPLECRILAIADAYDAMTHDRPYRQAMSQEAAVREIAKASGIQFDPVLVQKFLKLTHDNPEIGNFN